MNILDFTPATSMHRNETIQEVEESYFIGRRDELQFFLEFIKLKNPKQNVIHIYGESGIGKTYLLQEYTRISKQQQIPFFHLDCQDFTHTVQGFIDYLYTMLSTDGETNIHKQRTQTLHSVLELLKSFDRRIILAFDTYERMNELDRWFRDAFIRQLPSNVRILLAGRKALTGAWQESLAWRKLTKQIKLLPFNYKETIEFLKNNDVKKDTIQQAIWEYTGGHPLLISLATISNFNPTDNRQSCRNNFEILSILTKRWLNEVTDEYLIHLLEVAALFYQFDQNCLSKILNIEISTNQFNQLSSLSFVRKTRKGWIIHDLVRDAIRTDLQQRNPERYDLLSKKIIEFYYHRLINQPTTDDLASFFYHIGDDLIQSVIFHEAAIDTTMYLEPIDQYNFHEVETFFTHQKENITLSKTNYYNRTTNTTYQFNASLEHNSLELELVGPEYIRKIGYEGASLLKNNSGEVIGLSIVVPINSQTLPVLESDPVSSPYFAALTKKEKEYYQVPPEETAGYFIRYQDYKDPTDNSARSYLLYSLLQLAFSGGKIITSTPLKFFQDILYKFGFQTVPGAENKVYDQNNPTPTFLLDLSGPNLIPYLKKFFNELTKSDEMDMYVERFFLTNREQEIVRLLLEDNSIIEIAIKLHIAEITVKKALSRIYQKAGVKNRVQLIIKIMEMKGF